MVDLTIRLNGLFRFFKNTYTKYSDLNFGLNVPEALITPYNFFGSLGGKGKIDPRPFFFKSRKFN